MKLFRTSLSRTADSVAESFFFNQPFEAATAEEIANWIAARQGLEGSYSGMFAPTAADFRDGIRNFTGEAIRSGAALRHVSGEQACRALLLLNSKSIAAKEALVKATNGMREALDRGRLRGGNFFCCGTCDPSLWRHITAGGLRGEEDWLGKGMKALRALRDNEGEWRRFSFFDTVHALIEIDSKEARAERKYAAPRCERYLKSARGSTVMTIRRRAVCERALGQI